MIHSPIILSTLDYRLRDFATWSLEEMLGARGQVRNHIPRFINRSEAVTQKILRIQALHLIQVIRQMAFGRVIAKHVSHNVPYPPTAFQHGKVNSV